MNSGYLKHYLTLNVNPKAMPVENIIVNESKSVIYKVTEVKVVGKPTKVSTSFVSEDETFLEAISFTVLVFQVRNFLQIVKRIFKTIHEFYFPF